MKNQMFNLLSIVIGLILFSCKSETPKVTNNTWTEFKKCASNNCVKEALAVNDAFLKDPKGTLTQFTETYQKGEDHVIGWLYLMRDSVLFNSKRGTTQERFDLQQKMVAAARPFETDATLGEMAKSVVQEIENLAIASELEDFPEMNYPVTGTYAYELENNGGSGMLKVNYADLEHINFQLEVVGKAPAHNQGTMSGKAKLTEMNVYETETNEFGGKCRLQFVFTGNSVLIKTLEGESSTCGFGNGVVADNDYVKNSYDDPFLSAAESKLVRNLQGSWELTSEPTTRITFVDGVFANIYGESVEPELPYQYFPKGCKDCGGKALVPCIAVMGQDIVCYAVIKADGKTLQLTQIGGDGKLMTYRKMSSMSSNPKLQGKWVAADDKKYTLEIDGDRYMESHDGKPLPTQTFEWQATCKTPCGDTKDGSCIIVKGKFDATCYRIIDLTDKRLELSLIGGTGKSLVFNKK